MVNMVFVGLDLSITSTGVSFSTGEHFVVKTSPKDNLYDRIKQIIKTIFDVINKYVEEYGRENILVGIEGYSYSSVSSNATKLHELGGNIRFQLHIKGIQFFDIAPNSWKKYLFGSEKIPKATAKDLILLKTYKRYEMEFVDNNICDAYNIMKFVEMAYLYNIGEDEDFKIHEKDQFSRFFKGKNIKFYNSETNI